MDDEENVNEIQLPSSTKELNKPSQIAVIENNLFVSECENSTDRKRRWDVNEPEWSSSSGPSTLHVPVQIKKDKFSWIPSKPGKSATLPPTANMAEVLRCQKRQHTTDVRNSQLTASCVLILVVDIMIHQWVGDHYQILMGITFCAFIQILYIIDHHRQALLKQQLKDPLTKSLTIYNRYLLVELIANSLHCPPFLVTAWREARLLNICVIFKTASVMRLVRDHFFIDCLGGLLAGNLSRENVTMLFLAKTLLYRYPQRTILVLTIVVFLLNTVVLMSVENSSFWDIIWLQFVTMTTVGFGDVIPTRILGITVACVGSVQGILISSVSVALLTKELRKRTIARDVVGKCCRIVTIIKRLEDMKRRTEKEILGRSKTQKRCQALESQLNQHRIELDGLLRKKKKCRNEMELDVLEALHAPPLLVLQQETLIQKLVISDSHRNLSKSCHAKPMRPPVPPMPPPASNYQLDVHGLNLSMKYSNQVLHSLDNVVRKSGSLQSAVRQLIARKSVGANLTSQAQRSQFSEVLPVEAEI